jgi:hypothetical protein
MREIKKQKVQMINVMEDGSRVPAELQNRLTFGDTVITINDEERDTPEIFPVAISEKLKVLDADYLTIGELDQIEGMPWEEISEDRAVETPDYEATAAADAAYKASLLA